jgi:hypothetical protein
MSVELDGSILSYQLDHEYKLITVTVEGTFDGRPTHIMFSKDDLDTLNAARKELKKGPSEPDPGAVLSVLNAAGVSNRFIYDRVEYRYTDGEWVAQRRVDTEDDDVPVCECDEAWCPNFHIANRATDRFRKRRIRKAVTG